MAKYLRNPTGRKVVQMSEREYNGMRNEMQALIIQNSVQTELLRRQKAVMIAPQIGQSIWHPN